MLLISNGKVVVKDFTLYAGKKVRYERRDWPGEVWEGTLITSEVDDVIVIEPKGDSIDAPYVEEILWMEAID